MNLGYLKQKKINRICKKADELLEKDNWKEAIVNYKEIIQILPDSKTEYDAYNWTNITIGDIYYLNEKYEEALEYLLKAYNNYDKNGFLFLRIGESYFNLNQESKAEFFLKMAFNAEGRELFYDEDRKYLELAIREKINESNNTTKVSKWFNLSEEYEYLEKEYFSYDVLYLEKSWEIIYRQKLKLLEKIPDNLKDNQINWFIINDLLEASVFLNKIDELDDWFEKLMGVSKNRSDLASRLVWKAVIAIKKGNLQEGKNSLNKISKKYGMKWIKNFYHLENKVYDFYSGKVDTL